MGERLVDEYPGLIVRNTFLEIPVEEPAFLDIRRVQSAPSPVAREQAECFTERLSLALSQLSAERAVRNTVAAPAVLSLASMIEQPQAVSVTVPNARGAVSHVASAQVPTIGSARHHLGDCKPCAFMWKAPGCSNGANCTFCHLCDSGAKKRRQKEKKAALKVQSQDSQP